MKWVLVIDADENKKCIADIYELDEKGNMEMTMTCIPLKPLPCKLEELEGPLGQRFLSLKAFNRGWNACLEDITGETE